MCTLGDEADFLLIHLDRISPKWFFSAIRALTGSVVYSMFCHAAEMPIAGGAGDPSWFVMHTDGHRAELREPAPREPPALLCSCGRADWDHIAQARQELERATRAQEISFAVP